MKKLWSIDISLSSAWNKLEADTREEAIDIAIARLLSSSEDVEVNCCYEVDKNGRKLPDYALSDADKAVVKSLVGFDDESFFARGCGDVDFYNHNEFRVCTFYRQADMFNCVPDNGKVTLGELRRGL